MKKVFVLTWLACGISVCLPRVFVAQVYAPAAGQQGSSAVYKDSSVFVNWVSACTVTRGWQDISTPSLGLVSAGDASKVLGNADVSGVLSLGDGGSAICTFPQPITNGPGYDFAVFENSFNDDFLELAFVEVSSDGTHFVRFSAHSLSDTLNQCGTFGSTDASKLNNLAGKYRGGYGTPFDLQELSGVQGLDITRITHIKLVDVVGSLDKPYAQKDAHGNKVNDPWPTPFPSGGFDLDAIGVMHQSAPNGLGETVLEFVGIGVFPNPCNQQGTVHLGGVLNTAVVEVYSGDGVLLRRSEGNTLACADLAKGMYALKVLEGDRVRVLKLVVN